MKQALTIGGLARTPFEGLVSDEQIRAGAKLLNETYDSARVPLFVRLVET